jgi:alkylated DNA repair dioxygenase AlkB
VIYPPGVDKFCNFPGRLDRRKRLLDIFVESTIMASVYDLVHDYVHQKGNEAMLRLFEQEYGLTKQPRQLFLNLFDAGARGGVARHRDHSPFCTVVLSLSADDEHRLYVETENRECLKRKYQFNVGDMVIFDRLWHGVDTAVQKSYRLTANFFY